MNQRKTALGVASLALAVAGLVGGGGQAFAGSNGQQIRFHDSRHVIGSIYVDGRNQNNQHVKHCFDTPGATTVTWDYWWKGTATIQAYSGSGCDGSKKGFKTVNVPPSQPSDYYDVTI